MFRKKTPKNHWNAPGKKSPFSTSEKFVVYYFTKTVPHSCIFFGILRDISGDYSAEQSSGQAFSDSDEAAEQLKKN